MSTPRAIRTYLSSTFKDMVAERAAAIDVCRHYGAVVDSCRAGEAVVSATCISDVRSCDIFVGIIGKRYGYVPPAAENPRGLSITELEYEACRQPGQPDLLRLMFLKGRHDDEHIDADATRVDALRRRASTEQTAFPFKSVDEFRFALERAMSRESLALQGRWAEARGGMQGERQRADLLRSVALAKLAGTDDAVLRGCTDPRLHVFDISPADHRFLATLDAGLRRGQAGALWLSGAGLGRLASGPACERVAAAIASATAAGRPLVLLLDGVDPAQLPAAWGAAVAVPVPASWQATGEPEALVQLMRVAVPDISPRPTRLAVPYVVIAPTAAEIAGLLAPDRAGFAGYAEAEDRADRGADFERLAASARLLRPQWPAGAYEDRRHGWVCFGAAALPGQASRVAELIVQAVDRINAAPDGSRERRLLRQFELLPRAYDFDDVLNDRHGSAAAVLAAVQAGGLVVIDEFALLHPGLRAAAEGLLGHGGRSAVVSVSGCDPAHTAIRRLLGTRSFLRLGALVSRYADEQDPRCELAVNSVERLQRWLRLAIPDLVARGDGDDPKPALLGGVDQLLA